MARRPSFSSAALPRNFLFTSELNHGDFPGIDPGTKGSFTRKGRSSDCSLHCNIRRKEREGVKRRAGVNG